MFCYKCGTQLPDGAKMCHNCRTVFDPNFHPQQQTNNLRYTPDPRSNQPGQFGMPQNRNNRAMNQGFARPQNNFTRPQPAQSQPSAGEIASAVVKKIFLWLIIIFIVIPLGYIFIRNITKRNDGETKAAYTEVSVDSTSSTTETRTTEKQTTETPTTEMATTEAPVVATVEDSIIYEGNDVIVELKSLQGNTLTFYIENNSSKNLSTSMHAYAINGAMADNSMYDMYKSIAANSKSNITFDIPSVLESGYPVEEIRRMDFLIWFYDDDASYKAFDTGILTVKTNLYDDTLASVEGEELLNENGISYTLVDKDQDQVIIGINNHSENYYEFDGKNVVVNGYSLDTTYDFDIYGKLVFPDCSIPMVFEYNWNTQEDFKGINGISSIENVSLSFTMRQNGSYTLESNSSTISIEY